MKVSNSTRVTPPSYYISKIANKIKNDPQAHEFALMTWYRYMFPYIPFKTGALASTIHIEDDGIHFAMAYARRLYFGDNFNFSKEQHPLAQAHWGEVAMDIHEKAIANEVLAYIMRGETI